MIYASYFSNYKGENGVSIAIGTPKWFNGDRCEALMPPWELVNGFKQGRVTRKEYRKAYIKQLKKLDVDFYANLLQNKVVLCWEKLDRFNYKKVFCHRQVVCEWFTRNGYECGELWSKDPQMVCLSCMHHNKYHQDIICGDFCTLTGEIFEGVDSKCISCEEWNYWTNILNRR